MNAAGARAAWLKDAGAIALVKIAASCAVLASGFRAVSDDDYARVVIAEQWAHAPKLDPSGTSWLPLPFWLNGAAMLAFGRSLFVARAVAIASGVAAAILVFQAARWVTQDRRAALFGAGIAAVFPWSLRLGVATVPELFTAALALFAMATLLPDVPTKWRVWGGAALFAATLARYETWFVAAGFAALTAWDAWRGSTASPHPPAPSPAAGEGEERVSRESGERRGLVVAAAVAVLGPVLWVIWNRAAHDDALHFVTRVTAYHRALGGDARLGAGMGYLAALLRAEPELFAAAIACAIAMRMMGKTGSDSVRRYARPAALCALMIAALSISAAREGAPTHHSERALLVAMLLFAVLAGNLASRIFAEKRWLFGALVCAMAIAGAVLRAQPNAEAASVDRHDEVAIGEATARTLSPGERVLVEVSDYGYLAILAGLARPEDAVVDRDIDPRRAITSSSFDDAAALRTRLLAADAHAFIARRSAAASAIGDEREGGSGAWRLFIAKPATSEPPSATR